jgi:hypothetical protein
MSSYVTSLGTFQSIQVLSDPTTSWMAFAVFRPIPGTSISSSIVANRHDRTPPKCSRRFRARSGPTPGNDWSNRSRRVFNRFAFARWAYAGSAWCRRENWRLAYTRIRAVSLGSMERNTGRSKIRVSVIKAPWSASRRTPSRFQSSVFPSRIQALRSGCLTNRAAWEKRRPSINEAAKSSARLRSNMICPETTKSPTGRWSMLSSTSGISLSRSTIPEARSRSSATICAN